ncbi:hypothetical protein E2C01_086194 [Portunus trituberculatus]|uniref:Uncharacterized protein n=1 Tax=Portunus trituberculatus TaxID=210409 RepID=A0A5B7J908_PORTR|nr:hypothetical protein [Portunus trituberculatus]
MQLQKLMWGIKIVKTVAINLLAPLDPFLIHSPALLTASATISEQRQHGFKVPSHLSEALAFHLVY